MKSGIDLQHADPSVRVQDDLFGNINGGWLESHEIPADRASDGAFYALNDASEADVRTIIEQVASEALPGSTGAKVGDLYSSFMDVEAVQKRGRAPLAVDLAGIGAIDSLSELMAMAAELQRLGAVGGFLSPYVYTDADRPAEYALYLSQSGLGLPDESYYSEESFAEVRAAYVPHIARMLTLAGWGSDPAASAAAVLEVETSLAAAHWDKVDTRDAVKGWNPRQIDDLADLSTGWSVRSWLLAVGAPGEHVNRVVVRQPSYLTALPDILAALPVQAWKDWLAWSLVRRAAPLLDDEIVDANFDFYGRTLTGAPQLRERWKRAVGLVEGTLGEAVGELYVAKHFPPASKVRMLELVDNLVAAYRSRFEVLPWLSPQTRERALAKLAAFTAKVGYPDRWRDYSELQVDPADLIGNVRRAALLEADFEWRKLGGPVDRLEWFMTPQTVNAYYNPGMNEIVFPAAILQPPFFDPEADDAVNYGAIGAVIGHEIGHGFDDQGSRYDGSGALVDWWTEQDRAQFDALAGSLIAQYEGLVPRGLPEGNGVNGALTVGENIGDLGGITVAFEAYRLSLEGEASPVIDGLTGEQRFFFGWAQAWRAKSRTEEAVRLLAIDPHSPAEFRCNIVSNLTAFQEAFDVQPGDGMWRAPEDRLVIW